MNRRNPYLLAGLLFGAGLASWYGIRWEIHLLTGIGLLGLGLAVMSMGLEAVIKRESTETDEDGNTSTFRGWSALFVGALWLLVGIAVSGGGLVVLFGKQDLLHQWAVEHPGGWMAGLGLILFTHGGNAVLGSEEQRATFMAFLLSIPGRMIAFVVVLAGLGLVCAGFVELFLPEIFRDGIESYRSWKAGLIP
jgi:hypothetical protein